MKISKLVFSFLLLSTVTPTFACDLCGCYTPRLQIAQEKSYGFYLGTSEQFTHFSVDRLNGHEVKNTVGQYLDSSTTQIVAGATFLDNRFGLQVNVPLIYRSFKRPEGFDIDRGTESGVGDVSLLANFVVFRKEALFHETGGEMSKDGKTALPTERGEPDFTASLNLIAGMKFPTGDTSRIKEEFNEVEVEGAPESGIHGHDLSLGTGSFDGIFGAQLALRYKALFFQANVQYAWRGDGRYSYDYSDDLTWDGGPGVYIIRNSRGSLALQAVLSGETKDKDTFRGEEAADTGLTSLYVGPRVLASFGNVQGEVGAEFPVVMHTTAFQTTPEYRIRAALTVHF
jgi:hypothetical protein